MVIKIDGVEVLEFTTVLQMLGCGRKKLAALERDGFLIRPIKVGLTWFWPKSDVLDFIENCPFSLKRRRGKIPNK